MSAPGRCLLQGGICSWGGVSAPGGVAAPGGGVSAPRGVGIQACTEADRPPHEQND